jgi:predicted nucleotide-binding protein
LNLFKNGPYGEITNSSGEHVRFVFSGSIARVAEASAILCLELSARNTVYPAATRTDPMPDARKVFVVHGRNEKLRRDIFSFLRALHLHPIEWTEAISLTGTASPYIGEVLDAAFSEAQAIVVLLSPDDEVRLTQKLWSAGELDLERNYRLQPRANVIFEAGLALGRKPERTLILQVGEVKSFSDILGRHVLRLTNEPDKRIEFASRLEQAGCAVNRGGKDWLHVGDFGLHTDELENSTTQQNATQQQDKTDPDETEVKMMSSMAQFGKPVQMLYFVNVLKMSAVRAEHHLEHLEEIEFIRAHEVIGKPTTYALDSKGRSYLVRNNLVD